MRDYRSGIKKREPIIVALATLGLTAEEMALAMRCSRATIGNDIRRIRKHDTGFVVPRPRKNTTRQFNSVLHKYAQLSGSIQPDDELLGILEDLPSMQALQAFLDGAVHHYFSLRNSGATIPIEYKKLLKRAWHDPYLWEQEVNGAEARNLAQYVFDLFLSEVAAADEMSFSPTSAGAHLLKILDAQIVRADIVLHTDSERLVAIVNEALTQIPERQAQVLKMYFGIDCSSMPYKKIGEQYGEGVTVARIGQIIEASLANIKTRLQKENAASCVWTFSSLFAEQCRLAEENQRIREENGTLHTQLQTKGVIPLECDPDFQRILDTPIAELRLSVRSHHCLEAANVKTVYDLVQWKREELLKIKNLGRKSLNEILEVLTTLHPRLYLGMRLSS